MRAASALAVAYDTFHTLKVLWVLSGGRVPGPDADRVLQVAHFASCSLPAAARSGR